MRELTKKIPSHLFVERLHHALVNRIWLGLLLVLACLFPVTMVADGPGSTSTGPVFHVVLIVLTSIMVLGRKRLSLSFKAAVLGVSCLAVGAFGLSIFGMLGAEWFYTVFGIIIVGMVVSARAAIIMFVGALLTLLVFTWAYTSGVMSYHLSAPDFHRELYTWVLLASASMVLPAFVLKQVRTNQDALVTLIDEVQRQRDIISEQVNYDALTGLPSRRLVLDRLDMALKRLHRTQDQCSALLFIDLDGFKVVNDTHGHAAGDHVLRVVSERMEQSLRSDDTVARYAGDEFLVILNLIVSPDHAEEVALRLISAIEQPISYENATLYISASIGIKTFYSTDTESRDALIGFADQAMYEAKKQGKGRHVFYRDCLDAELASP